MNNDISENRKLNFISFNNKKNNLFEIKKNNNNSLIYYICNSNKRGFILVIFFQILILIYFIRFSKIIITNIFQLKKSQDNIIKNSNITYHFLVTEEMYSNNTKNKYSAQQDFFCQHQILFQNYLIEEKLKSVKINLENKSFNMLVYKKDDTVSDSLSLYGFWERKETKNILFSLLYYAKKKNITKNDIYILDIGANIGWYSLFLGKKGYNIISFEPSPSNYYILLKNFCLNKEISISIINSGLDSSTKNCSLYHPKNNIGNALTFDGKKKNLKKYIKEDIKLSKLSDYLPYLINKNLAFIKLDIEGSEVKALEGGLDLITKYHVPFILMEWSPDLIMLKGSDPKLFLEMLENNGYKISKEDFLSKQFIPLEQLLKETKINIYIIYLKFLE